MDDGEGLPPPTLEELYKELGALEHSRVVPRFCANGWVAVYHPDELAEIKRLKDEYLKSILP